MNWLTMRQTPLKSRKLKSEQRLALSHYKTRNVRQWPNLRLPLFLSLLIIDIAVLLALLNQISHIFVLKVDIRHTPVIPLSHLICAIDAVNEDIGPIIVPSETNQPDLNLIDIAEYGEIDQGVYCSAFVYGKLRSCLSFWRDTICASDFVLDIIKNGYKIPFKETPVPYSIENRSSAKSRDSFVREAISELLVRGCIRQVATYILNIVIHLMLLFSLQEN